MFRIDSTLDDPKVSTTQPAEDARALDRFVRSPLQRAVLRQLRELRGGQVTLERSSGQSVCVGTPGDDGLHATVRIHDDRFFRELAFGGSLGAAEAYLQGLWDTAELVTLIRIVCRNLNRPETTDSAWSSLAAMAARCVHWLASNTRRGARKNIAAHYDFSNQFFEQFLDPSMLYSSGLFDDEERRARESLPSDAQVVAADLQAASIAKIDRACRVLGLQPGDRLLEIGTGWGALAEHAARHYGCHVTTTTISRQQWEYARRRIAVAGLNDRVSLLFEDYRDLPRLCEPFDHLVSIEMIEAVGHRYLPLYFHTCAQMVNPGGKVLIQAITIPDARYERYRRSVDFIQKYVFPGGHLPSVEMMRRCADRTGRLQAFEACEFPQSYAMTLRSWRRRFLERAEEVRKLGFDDRFLRLWDYYLCYCEGAFLERAVGVGQFVWTRVR